MTTATMSARPAASCSPTTEIHRMCVRMRTRRGPSSRRGSSSRAPPTPGSRSPRAWRAVTSRRCDLLGCEFTPACLAGRDVEAVEGAQTALERHHLTRGVCGLRHPAPRQILRNLQGAEHKWARVHDVSVRADYEPTARSIECSRGSRSPPGVWRGGETLKTGHVADHDAGPHPESNVFRVTSSGL